MASILEKAGELGSAIADKVGDAVDGLKDVAEDTFNKETGFLVEKFPDEDELKTRLNDLQPRMKSVDVQAICTSGPNIIAVIKITD